MRLSLAALLLAACAPGPPAPFDDAGELLGDMGLVLGGGNVLAGGSTCGATVNPIHRQLLTGLSRTRATSSVPATYAIARRVPAISDGLVQVRISNRNASTGVHPSASFLLNLSVGTSAATTPPSYSGTPTTYTNVTIPGGGAEYVSPWIPVTRGSDGKIVVSYTIPEGTDICFETYADIESYRNITTAAASYPLPALTAEAFAVLQIEILFSTAATRVNVLGDSLTGGLMLNDIDNSFCTQLQAGYAINPWGLSGATLADYNNHSYLTEQLTNLSGSVVVIAAGINDLNVVASTWQSRHATLVSTLFNAGASKIVGVTISPNVAFNANDSIRLTNNAYLRALPAHVNAVSDSLGALTYNPGDPTHLLAADDAGDGNHWSASGHGKVYTDLATVLGSL